MYICLDCGRIFGEPKHRKDGAGFWWGEDCEEEVSECPYCKGDYEEAEKCCICGLYFADEKLLNGVCTNCIEKHKKDFDFCYNIHIGEKKSIEINSFLASAFEVSDIEQILVQYIREKWKDIDCGAIIDDDYWLSEKIKKEVKKDENAKG